MGVVGIYRSQGFPLRRFLLVLALGGATSNVVLAEPQPVDFPRLCGQSVKQGLLVVVRAEVAQS